MINGKTSILFDLMNDILVPSKSSRIKELKLITSCFYKWIASDITPGLATGSASEYKEKHTLH